MQLLLSIQLFLNALLLCCSLQLEQQSFVVVVHGILNGTDRVEEIAVVLFTFSRLDSCRLRVDEPLFNQTGDMFGDRVLTHTNRFANSAIAGMTLEGSSVLAVHQVVLYSHAIATSSSVIGEYVLGKYQDIDFGGLISLLKRVFSDIDFIYDVKFEFLKSGLSEALFFD